MRTRRALLLLLGSSWALACAGARFESSEHAALTMPARIAEGSDQDAGASADGGDGRTLVGAAERQPPPGGQPDPAALRQTRQYEYDVVYEQGKVRVSAVRAVRFQRPVVTARMMGRFAIELWIGKELVERVRFDFPLVAAEDPRRKKARPLDEPPSFASGVVATQTVLVPASSRATRALLVDRATGEQTELPWPPEAPLGPARTSSPRSEAPDASAAEDAQIADHPAGDAGASLDAATD